MFKASKAVEKLKQIESAYSLDKMFSSKPTNEMVLFILREVLLAGESDELDSTPINKDSFGQVLLTASQFGEFRRFFEDQEQRIARLEERIIDHNSHHYANDWHDKYAPGPVTEEKPTEFAVTSIDAVVWAKEFMRCYKKSGYEIDEDTMRGWFANSIMAGFDEANRRNKKDDKPSECPKHTEEDIDEITQTIRIPRDVAEEWFDSMDDGHNRGKDPDARLLRAIKQALKG